MSDQDQAAQLEYLTERLAELELQLEDREYLRLGHDLEREFSREALRQINRLARLFYLKNPLIGRGVNVQAHYVFGQGINIRARAAMVNNVVQAFLDDPANRSELTSHQARMQKEVELTLFGDLFFVFFVNKATGRVRVRTIVHDEVEDIICNPEDAKEPWFYKRVWMVQILDLDTGQTKTEQRTAYYPDWRYRPADKPQTIGGKPVMWDTPVYHVKDGALSDMKFGLSQVYASLDWAKAYKKFLEDWATIVRAYSRFAWNLTTKGGAKGVTAARTKLGTTYGAGAETNPPPVTGSTFIASEGTKMEPIRTAGATTSAEDGRRLLLMVAAGTGLPESFFGDVSVGTLATAKSLDRPTELKMVARQTFWGDIHREILSFVVLCAVLATGGELKGTVSYDADGKPAVLLPPDPDQMDPETGEPTGEPADPAVDVTFPPILEHDVNTAVGAIVDAATLKGSQSAGTMDDRTLSRLLLQALGVDDIDEILDKLFPPGQEEEPSQPEGEPDEDDDTQPAAEREADTAMSMMVEAVRELREALQAYARKHGSAPAGA